MQGKILGPWERSQDSQGLPFGIFFLLYSGLIQYLLRKTADLEPAQAYAAFHTFTILDLWNDRDRNCCLAHQPIGGDHAPPFLHLQYLLYRFWLLPY